MLGRDPGAQSRDAFGFKQRLEFVRRPGEQHEDSLLAIVLSGNPLAGRGAEQIRQHRCASQDVGLLGIVRGHLYAALGEPLFELRDEIGIALQFQTQRVGHRLARQVIFSWAEAARENDDVGTPHGEFGGCG